MSAGQPVVIGLDGSVHSTRTLAWGLSEARLRGADVVLAHVVPDPADAIRIGWYPLGEDVDADLEGQRYRSDVLRTARDRAPGLAIESRLLRGPTVAALVALAQGAQLVVVGAGGSSDLSRPGTVGMRLVARAPCPVAVVHDPHPGASSRAPVVVGVDGSDCALVAARVAAREAALRRAPLVVVHARAVASSPYAPGRAAPPVLPPARELDATPEPAQRAVALLRRDHPALPVSWSSSTTTRPGPWSGRGGAPSSWSSGREVWVACGGLWSAR